MIMAERGWAPDDGDNEGLSDRKAETDRLNAKSNAEQQAASHPEARKPETPAEDAAASEDAPKGR
jgi:hypothetical protein